MMGGVGFGLRVRCEPFRGAIRHPLPASYVGEWLSLVEHLVRDQGVGGSNPLSPTIFSQADHWISCDPNFGICTIWVRLGPLSNCSTFSTAFRASAGIECK